MYNLANILKLFNQKGIGSTTIKALLEKSETIDDIFTERFYSKLNSIKVRDAIKSSLKDKVDYERILKEKSIGFKFILDDDYPENLKNSDNAPAIIYYKGNWDSELFKRPVSVVGTRRCSVYGKNLTYNFSKELSHNGFTIVSGMAFGIDKQAHLAALENSGKTIAVLASSVDQPSPEAHRNIYNNILDSGGLVISEYFPGTVVRPGFFAQRNKIVAGLSNATLVVEAPKKSGALITANLAFEDNRQVFAIPGNINNKLSEGCNTLISEGKAKLVQSIKDITDELNVQYLSSNTKNILKNLKSDEKDMLKIVSERPMYIDEVAKQANLNIHIVSDLLFNLEMNSLIKKENGKYYTT